MKGKYKKPSMWTINKFCHSPFIIWTSIILSIYITYILRGTRCSRILADNGYTSQDIDGSFQLAHIYKHGVGANHRRHAVLDINEENIALLSENYQNLLNNIKYNVDNGDDTDESLWTNNFKYQTDNPFVHEFNLRGRYMVLHRMANRHPDFVESYLDFALESPRMAAKVVLDWVEGGEEVLMPDVRDKDTVISLALMSSNAYVKLPQTGDWRNISEPWDKSESSGYGWDGDTIRGHVFYNAAKNIVVLSIKGTSAQGIPGSGEDETTGHDKINDNLLFSCCCARVSYLWTTVCDCYIKSYTCDEVCLEASIKSKDHYYKAVMEIYRDILKTYPGANVWTTGHSLGGALASLLGRTYGLPTLTFESPGELLATRRLHLPTPPGLPAYSEGIWHVGHTADPIFLGTCNGASSTCSIAGYAMETACHSGKTIIYDVSHDKGWHVNMLNHRIHTVIDGILTEYDEVPKAEAQEDCVDCFNWNFVPNRESTETKTSSKKSTTTTTQEKSHKTKTKHQASTSTCIGRNWIGICTDYTQQSHLTN